MDQIAKFGHEFDHNSDRNFDRKFDHKFYHNSDLGPKVGSDREKPWLSWSKSGTWSSKWQTRSVFIEPKWLI